MKNTTNNVVVLFDGQISPQTRRGGGGRLMLLVEVAKALTVRVGRNLFQNQRRPLSAPAEQIVSRRAVSAKEAGRPGKQDPLAPRAAPDMQEAHLSSAAESDRQFLVNLANLKAQTDRVLGASGQQAGQAGSGSTVASVTVLTPTVGVESGYVAERLAEAQRRERVENTRGRLVVLSRRSPADESRPG